MSKKDESDFITTIPFQVHSSDVIKELEKLLWSHLIGMDSTFLWTPFYLYFILFNF